LVESGSVERVTTRQRILDTALDSFGRTGLDGTSLDDLARSLGIRKQTILYYFPSKVTLFEAVVDEAADTFVAELADVVAAEEVWDQVEGTVRVVFRLAVQRPALLGLLREASRPGSRVAVQLTGRLSPLIESARHSLEIALKEGTVKGDDARLLLFSLYSTVMGVATEVEVLRAMGIEPTLRSLAERRIELLRFLREALINAR
jgi:TetR/AcrR family transcriptional regulator